MIGPSLTTPTVPPGWAFSYTSSTDSTASNVIRYTPPAPRFNARAALRELRRGRSLWRWPRAWGHVFPATLPPPPREIPRAPVLALAEVPRLFRRLAPRLVRRLPRRRRRRSA